MNELPQVSDKIIWIDPDAGRMFRHIIKNPTQEMVYDGEDIWLLHLGEIIDPHSHIELGVLPTRSAPETQQDDLFGSLDDGEDEFESDLTVTPQNGIWVIHDMNVPPPSNLGVEEWYALAGWNDA